MKRGIAALAAAPALIASAPLPSSPQLGQAEARCRTKESGPALLVDVVGLKDRRGLLKLEVYPSNDRDFLADDNALVNAGKVFRRVELRASALANPLCIRVPEAGSYSVALLHDRDANHKFGWLSDGVGFAGNPHIRWSKPGAAATSVAIGSGLTRIRIVLNYRRGLGMAPLPVRGHHPRRATRQ